MIKTLTMVYIAEPLMPVWFVATGKHHGRLDLQSRLAHAGRGLPDGRVQQHLRCQQRDIDHVSVLVDALGTTL